MHGNDMYAVHVYKRIVLYYTLPYTRVRCSAMIQVFQNSSTFMYYEIITVSFKSTKCVISAVNKAETCTHKSLLVKAVMFRYHFFVSTRITNIYQTITVTSYLTLHHCMSNSLFMYVLY